MDTAARAEGAAPPPEAGGAPPAPGPGGGRSGSAAAPRRSYRFRDALRHSSAAHLLVFLALFLSGAGPKQLPRPERREVLIAFHAPSVPTARAEPEREPERELDTETPPEPEVLPVEPEVEAPLPEPELAEVSDPRALLRRLPPDPLTRVEPPPADAPPERPGPEPLAEAPEPTPPAPVSVAAVRRAPVLLASQAPDYPLASYRMGHQGAVLLRILVARDGTVIDVELVESSGYERLDQAALAAARRWRFRPASEDGATIDDAVLHRVVFRIES